jgi:CrcB protein
MSILLFSLGAAIGAPLRFWVDNLFRPKYKFPIGIFIVNILGSFLIGFIAEGTLSNSGYLLLGFCGALTTWSTFIVDLYLGYRNQQFRQVALNLGLSLLLGVFAFQFGFSLASA